MKKRNKTLLAIFVILLLLISFCGFNFTTTTDTSNVTKDEYTPWNDELDKKLKGLEINTLYYNSNTEKRVIVQDSSTISTKKHKNDTIRYESSIEIRYVLEDFNVGLGRYFPLYKNVSYSSKIIYGWSANVTRNKTNSILQNKGQFKIDGHTIISGICSAANAKIIIKKNIEQKIKGVIQQEIDNQITAVK
jgi:hypothetical protein